jgi:hypothetical protein
VRNTLLEYPVIKFRLEPSNSAYDTVADLELIGKITKWQKNVDGKRPLGRLRLKWDDNMTKDLKEMGEGCGTHSSASESGLEVASSQRGNGTSGCIKDQNFASLPLFCDAVGSSGHTASNDWMIGQKRIEKDVEGSYRKLIPITAPEFAWNESGNV